MRLSKFCSYFFFIAIFGIGLVRAVNVSYSIPTPENGSSSCNNNTFINITGSGTSDYNLILNYNSNLYAYWNFEEFNTTQVADISGRNYGLNYNGTDSSYIVSGRYGKSISLNGTSMLQSYTFPDYNTWNTYTISLWFKYENRSVSSSGLMGAIFSKMESSSRNGTSLYIANNSGTEQVRWKVSNSTTGLDTLRTNSSGTGIIRLKNGVWYHAVIVKNTKEMLLFFNGTRVYDMALTAGGLPNNSNVYSNSNRNLQLGNYGTITFALALNGSIDEFFIDSRAWSDGEIYTYYNSTQKNYTVNFTQQATGNYTVQAFGNDIDGNWNKTPIRTFEITYCAACNPSYYCSVFTSCNVTDRKGCSTVADNQSCGIPYPNSTSQLDATCDFCLSNPDIKVCEVTKMYQVSLILIPILFGVFCIIGAVTLGRDHPALKIGLFLISLVSVFGSLYLASAAIGASNSLLQDATGRTVYWIGAVFGVIVIYFIMYLLYKLFDRMRANKEEKNNIQY